ncbi:MAG TPA: DHA2 family efflux MFS transporter permease subunit [Acidimicrobiales bacterium]|nr:DHA2 family efflux MFS transporter permease subunit [Acidimicrobiales bacterium]
MSGRTPEASTLLDGTATGIGTGAAPAPSDRRWLILVVLCLSVFLVVVDNTIVNVALPTLNRHLGASITSLQWIVDAYSLAFAGLLLAGGGVGDRLGRKGTMQVGLVFFGIFSAFAAASHSTGTLITSRALMGIAAAFIFPASLAILTTVFPDPSERQKALGIWGAVSGIAVAFGPVVGGALLQHFWYGSIFLVNVPIVVVTLIAGQLLIPRLPRIREHRFDVRGMLLSTAGVTSLVLAIIEGPQWGWTATGTMLCFAAAAVLLTVFTFMELRTAGPLLDVRVFRIRRFTGGAVSVSVAFFCLFGFIFLITEYFQFVKGYSTLSAGVHTLPFAVVAAVFTPLAAVVALRVGSRAVVSVGLLLMGGGLVMAAFNSQANTAYWGPIVFSMVLLALGLSAITAPTAEAVMGSVPNSQRGAAAGVNNTTRELGGTLGVAVFGSIFASSYAPKIISAFRPLPIPAAPKAESHQSVAAALAVVHRAPHSVQPALETIVFHAFHSGLLVACLAGAGVAVVGAVAAFRLLPGRAGVAAAEASALEPRVDGPDELALVSP